MIDCFGLAKRLSQKQIALVRDLTSAYWPIFYDESSWGPDGDDDWPEMCFIRDHIIRPGDVVLECGAHHGYVTTLFSTWVGSAGKVICFEPHPNNANILQRNIELNALGNVVLERKAVGV